MRIKGKSMWASVLAPNTKYTPQWEIDLILTQEQVPQVEKLGLKVKKTDDGPTVKFKRAVDRKDGEKNEPPVVVDADKNPFRQLIGNGSDVIVQFHVWETQNQYGKFTGADLQGVQVINLIPVEGARVPDGAEFDAVDEDDLIDDTPVKAPASKAKAKAPPAPVDFDDDDLPDTL